MKIVDNKAEVKLKKFEDLVNGQCFKWNISGNTDLLMKTDYEQDAISLIDGEYYSELCGDMVIPINAEVHIIN